MFRTYFTGQNYEHRMFSYVLNFETRLINYLLFPILGVKKENLFSIQKITMVKRGDRLGYHMITFLINGRFYRLHIEKEKYTRSNINILLIVYESQFLIVINKERRLDLHKKLRRLVLI